MLSSGFEHLKDYVLPFISSVLEQEPDIDLTIVDNGSPIPYPSTLRGVPVFRTDNLAILTSFNRAITAAGHWDWLIISDTDVLCRGQFLDAVAHFDAGALHGQQMFSQGNVHWFDSWLLAIPRWAWEDLGPFDEDFLLTGAFQDMDFCLRAAKHGLELAQSSLPFTHIGANTTHGSPKFWENREYNRSLIEQKHGVRLAL